MRYLIILMLLISSCKGGATSPDLAESSTNHDSEEVTQETSSSNDTDSSVPDIDITLTGGISPVPEPLPPTSNESEVTSPPLPNCETKLFAVYRSNRALDGSDSVIDPTLVEAFNRHGSAMDDVLDVSNAWTVSLDGAIDKPSTRLTKSNVFQVNLNPAGDKVVYASNRPQDGSDSDPEPYYNLWIHDLVTGTDTRITDFNLPGAFHGGTYFHPTQDLIYFQNNIALPDKDDRSTWWVKDPTNLWPKRANLWSVEVDGSNLKALTEFEAVGYVGPFRSFDGNKIYFSATMNPHVPGYDSNYSRNVWVYDTVLETFSNLTDGGTNIGLINDFPSYSPLDDTIIYSSNRDELDPTLRDDPHQVWIMNSDGSQKRKLTNLNGSQYTWSSTYPRYSQNYQNIIISSNTHPFDRSLSPLLNGFNQAVANIWTVSTAGGDEAPITTGIATSSIRMEYVDNDNKLIHVSNRNLDGSDTLNLDDSDPTDTIPSHNIWLVNRDGTNLTPITQLKKATVMYRMGIRNTYDEVVCP